MTTKSFLIAATLILAFSGSALADGWHHGWGHHGDDDHGWHHGWWGPRAYVYAPPPPVYYAPPPPVYYAPPPVVYAPPVVVAPPSIVFGFSFH